MPQVTNPGLSTVHSDGVTIQGVGSVASPIAIKAVQTDATLTGAGTVASPLSASAATPIGWPLTWWFPRGSGAAGSTAFASTINTLSMYGVIVDAQVAFGHIFLTITNVDAGNLYDAGLYNSAGTLVAHIGAQGLPSAATLGFAIVGGPVTINPGRYYFATTGNNSTGQLQFVTASGDIWIFYRLGNFGASAGGVLPSSITPPADIVISTFGPSFALGT